MQDSLLIINNGNYFLRASSQRVEIRRFGELSYVSSNNFRPEALFLI